MISTNIIPLANYLFALTIPISHSVAYVWCGLGFLSVFSFWKKLRSEPIIIWVTIFIIYGLILSFFSAKPMVGFNTMLNYFSHWLLPLILGYCLYERKKIFLAFWMYYWLFIGLIFFSVLAYFGFFWKNIGNNYLVHEGLLKGFRHHIGLAALSINLAFLSFTISLFSENLKKNRRLFFILTGLFLVGAVGLTGSRGYYLASSISLFTFLAWLIIVHKKYLFGGSVFIVLMAIIIGFYFTSPIVRSRVESGINLSDRNVTERLDLYKIALLEIKDKPIIGFGPGQSVYQKKYFDIIKTGNIFNEEGKPTFAHLHSFYLNLSAEFGLTGLLIFFVILFFIIKRLFAVYSTEVDFLRAISIGLLFGLLAFMVGECFDTHFRGPGLAMNFFWLVGLICGAKPEQKNI